MSGPLTTANQPVQSYAYFDMAIDGKPAGRIVFGLFSKALPKTCANFSACCSGNTTKDGIKLDYKGSPFHRVIPGFMLQGGDFTNRNGTGGYSLEGRTFPDEGFPFDHDAPYLLSMANRGKNTNSSQFFITTVPTPHLDNKHVVFGRVVGGQDVVKTIEALGSRSGSTSATITVAACGEGQGDTTKA